MSEKRRSIYTILLLRIIIVVILFNVVAGGLIVYDTENLQARNDEIIQRKTRNEIAGLMDSWDAILKSMDAIFSVTLEYAMQKIINIHFEQDLGTVDLYQQMKLAKLDTSYIDFHVIKDTIIVNTTSPSLLNVNLFSIENEHNNWLSQINKGGRNVVEPWIMDNNTKRFRIRGYIATRDNKYIVKVECYSRLADELMVMFTDRIKRVVKENENILSVNNYIGDELHYSGIINDTIIYELHDSLISRAFLNKSSITKMFSNNKGKFVADYVFNDRDDQQWHSGRSVFEIITGIPDYSTDIYKILKKYIIILLSLLIVLSIIFLLSTRKIKITLHDLHKKTKLIANGNLKERVIVSGQNEFSALAEQFNLMVEQLESTQNELKQKNDLIGKNNKMLQEKNEEITIQRDKIETQRDEIEAHRVLVTRQKDKILEHKQSITDSIQYASLIQAAILPPDEVIKYLLPKHFILYKPRDIVSGDFYWLTHRQGEIIILVADCTGHGVPGAFMSMLGSALLKDVVNSSNVLKANQILNDLREKVILSLRQTGKSGEAKDGMDISLCIINTELMKLQYAGAYQPLFLIRKGTLKEFKADKMPIGISSKAGKSFKNNEIKIFKDDLLYLFSDGYVDQFGGESGKKFLSSRFKQLLIEIQDNIMFDQKEILNQNINEWMGLTGLYEKYDQVDDITVLGIKI